MTQTIVLGSNGGVGRHLVQRLKAEHQDFTAAVRKDQQVTDLQKQDINAIQVDVEKDDIPTLASKLKGYDQVVFSVGSGAKTGAEQTLAVDLDGAVKAIKASEAANVSHFIMVSTYDSRREAIEEGGALKPYTIAKHYADDYLRHSSLTATIVHPGALTDEDGTGKVRVADLFDDPGERQIPREDVARVLYEVVTQSDNQGKEFQVLSGDTDIHKAVLDF